MPNGHGGIPRFGSPVLIFLVTFLFVWWARSTASVLPQVLSVIGAGIFGWRLAFHMTMWGALEYDGRYSFKQQIKNSKRNYFIARLLLMPLAILLAYWVVSV